MTRIAWTRRAALGAVVLLTTVSCAQLRDLPRLDAGSLNKIKLAQSSKIYDADGNLVTTLHGEQNRTIIPLARIPKHVQHAVVAIEDERFYDHEGVDLKAVIRAFLTNATSGEVREGGSTITQQLVKNTIIAPGGQAEKTLERKIHEAALSRQLEKELTKDQILERYLNTVYFGEGAYGVQAAARTFFGKNTSRLDLGEAAMLAGLIQSPEDYNPYKNVKAARARRNTVLAKMQELGWADAAAMQKASRSKIKLERTTDEDRYAAPYFIDYVQRMITYNYEDKFDKVGTTVAQRTKRLFQGGLKIFTTVDTEMQQAAEDAVASVLPLVSDPYASLVAIDPRTGHVKAMVGGRDWFAKKKDDAYSKLNLAILAEPGLGYVTVTDPETGERVREKRAPGTGRHAGSAFKTFALVAALEDGISLSKIYKGGTDITIPGVGEFGEPYTVQNYEGTSFKDLSLLEGTVNSVNVVYAQVVQDVGPEDVVEAAAEMGIRTPLEPYFSAVLGTNEVNPMGMASAYGTLATNGVHHDPVAITKIVAPDGRVLYQDETEGEQVISASDAYLATTALQQVIERGTGTNARIGRPAAGKTGTAQEYRDAWFVGYTPELVASVWVGYPKGQIEMKPSCAVTFIGDREVCRVTRTITSGGVTGGSFPAQVWAAFMLRALAGVPASSFAVPDVQVVTVEIDTRQGDCLAGKFTPEEFVAEATFEEGTEPNEHCRFEGERVEVPDVFGFPVDEAVRTLESAGFDVVQEQEASSTYPPGRVIAQDPEGGAKANSGATILIIVSARSGDVGDEGDETAAVPDVLGYRRAAAEAALRREGFNVRVIVEWESNPGQAKKNKGRVWKQSPAGATRAQRGATVTIWVNPT